MSNFAASYRGSVLIVDDTPANLNLLFAMLTNHGYKVRAAINGNMALKSVFAALPELILLDINMPEMNGFDVCRQLKADIRTRDIPIIFISASDETEDKVRAFDVGGVDYVTKPFQVEEVLARVGTQMMLYQQRRELEEFRQREIDYFKDLNHMKDQFVATVSHDLKNPIGVIKGYADLLEKNPALANDPQAQDYIKRIRRGAEQMLILVTDLLDLAKIEAGMELGVSPNSLDGFLRDQLENFGMLAENKSISLGYTPPRQDVMLMFDPNRMSQVIKNLLSNAIKYTHDGGKVDISTETRDHHVLIKISDSGLGIPTEDIPFIFDKFYRVSKQEYLAAADGTGLGLSITKAIVEQHRGTIRVESEVGKGSVFHIELPLLEDAV